MSGGSARGGQHFGPDFKREARDEYGWGISLAGSGEAIRSDANYIDLDPDVKDAWGIPAAQIQLAFGDNERAMVKDMTEWGIRLLEAAGAEIVGWQVSPSIPGGQITEQGTCRMGNDPKKFVTNRWGQCHDVPDLVVGDGAINVTPASQNPTLTIMTLAMRNAAHLAEPVRRRDLFT